MFLHNYSLARRESISAPLNWVQPKTFWWSSQSSFFYSSTETVEFPTSLSEAILQTINLCVIDNSISTLNTSGQNIPRADLIVFVELLAGEDDYECVYVCVCVTVHMSMPMCFYNIRRHTCASMHATMPVHNTHVQLFAGYARTCNFTPVHAIC